MSDYDILFKWVLVGDAEVGKSSLLQCYTGEPFRDNYISTIGVDFKIATRQVKGKTVKLQIWDLAGQERFQTITKSYYRGAHGAIFVYDMSKPDTFERLPVLLEEFKKHAADNVATFLIGSKCDLPKAISTEQAAAFAQSAGFLGLFEASAKTNTNVTEAFDAFAEACV